MRKIKQCEYRIQIALHDCTECEEARHFGYRNNNKKIKFIMVQVNIRRVKGIRLW